MMLSGPWNDVQHVCKTLQTALRKGLGCSASGLGPSRTTFRPCPNDPGPCALKIKAERCSTLFAEYLSVFLVPRHCTSRGRLQELQMEVCRVANMYRHYGAKKGDRITIYMPMIPEAAYTMLAAARLGRMWGASEGGVERVFFGRLPVIAVDNWRPNPFRGAIPLPCDAAEAAARPRSTLQRRDRDGLLCAPAPSLVLCHPRPKMGAQGSDLGRAPCFAASRVIAITAVPLPPPDARSVSSTGSSEQQRAGEREYRARIGA